MRSILVLLALLAGLSACGKKTYKQFYELDARQTLLVADQGDAAYELPEMDDIITALDAVPDNAREKDRAIALVTQLKAERARVKAESAPPVAVVPPPRSPEVVAPSTVDAPLPVRAVDAGNDAPTEPVAGMSEADFVKYFGTCFRSGDPMTPPGSKERLTAQELLNDTDCRTRFHAEGTRTLYLFRDDKLFSIRVLTVRDAGVAPVPPPTQPPAQAQDAGGVFYVPGAPRPQGTYPPEPGAPAPSTVTPTGQPSGIETPPPAAPTNTGGDTPPPPADLN